MIENHRDTENTEYLLKQQIGQMIVVRASGYLFDEQIRYPVWEPVKEKLRHWLQTLNLGGVILLGGSAAELFLRIQQLQTWSSHPLLIAADIEEGVGQRFSGATWFPPPMALGAIAKNNLSRAKEYAFQMGAVTAREAQAIGINWLLAPVVDVNNNPLNPVINVRSFGDTPFMVGELAASFIQGAKSSPVLTTAKHFPGHGDTSMDSHLDLPVIPHSPERLQSVELPPFQRAIASGVDSIMSAHLLIPAWDKERAATLSPTILTGQLREKLGFEGLIVTDALIMGGVARHYTEAEIAVMAVEAGADILLMPADPVVAIEAVYQAVISGRIPQERIAQSVARISQFKQNLHLCQPCVSPENKAQTTGKLSIEILSDLQARETVRDILTDSMEKYGVFPLHSIGQNQGRNLIVVDEPYNCDFLGRHTGAVTIPPNFGYQTQIVSPDVLSVALDDNRKTLLQVFLRGNPFRGSAGLTEKAKSIYRKMLKSDLLSGVIIYGSPYVLNWFKSQINSDIPLIFSYGQMPSAQTLACQVMFNISSSSDCKENQLRQFM